MLNINTSHIRNHTHSYTHIHTHTSVHMYILTCTHYTLHMSTLYVLKKVSVEPLLKKVSLDPDILKNTLDLCRTCPVFQNRLEKKKKVLSQLLSRLEQNSQALECFLIGLPISPQHGDGIASCFQWREDRYSDSDRIYVVTLHDLSATFDTAGHDLMLSRLRL